MKNIHILRAPAIICALWVLVASSVACTSDRDAPYHLSQLGGQSGSDSSGGGGSLLSNEPVGGAAGGTPLEPEQGVCAGYVCGSNQTCVAVDDFATCQCQSGFLGPDCHDVNECSTPNRCGVGGKCVNYQGTFSCECAEGNIRDAEGCKDTNECKLGLSACDSQATCSDSDGSHICTCDPGLYGDGTFCKGENSCLGSPCGEGTCRNTITGFACQCPIGISGPQCEASCPLDSAIQFGSGILEQAVRDLVAVSGDITPRMLSEFSELYVPPPDSKIVTDDEIKTLDGLECWPTLRVLDLRGHGVTELGALRSLGSLETLNLTCNRADDLSPLAGLSKLRDLSLGKGILCSDSERQATDFDLLQELTSLRRLDAGFFGLGQDTTAFEHLKRLKFLDLSGNELKDVSGLAGLVQLEHLSLAQNPLANTSALSQLGLLKRLNLAHTGSSSFDALAQLERLEELDLSGNDLTSVKGLEQIGSLRILRLSDNSISDLKTLGSLEQLLVLDVQGNQIESLAPLADNLSFASGQLWLSNNPVDCIAGAADLRALRNRGVKIFGACVP